MKQLSNFAITVRETDFVLQLQDDGGDTVEYAASPEQLDAVIDALDELLSDDDDLEEGDDGQIYQKPLG